MAPRIETAAIRRVSGLRSRGASQSAGRRAPVRSPLLAEAVANAIVERAARGYFQPGQRLIETEVARELGVSRLPVREALKTLESQGIVASTPHRGTRLMEVDEAKLAKLLDVHVQLELLALRSALPFFHGNPAGLKPLDRVLRQMERAASKGDRFAVATAAVRFHREICVASDNEVLVKLWEALSRHLAVAFGMPTVGEPSLQRYYRCHLKLRNVIAKGDLATVQAALERHIQVGCRSPPGKT